MEATENLKYFFNQIKLSMKIFTKRRCMNESEQNKNLKLVVNPTDFTNR